MIEELAPTAFPLVNRFFKANGHKGKVRSDERVFVLKHNQQIVAALRACPKAKGYLLRSIWVATQQRGQGFGLTLIRAALTCLSPAPCWCYPYNHLRDFYLKAGMTLLAPEQTPLEIRSPWESYNRKGHDFLLMGACHNTVDSFF